MLRDISAFVLPGIMIAIGFSFSNVEQERKKIDPETNYRNYCAGCHGEKMDMFVDRNWKFGNKKEDLFKSVKYGRENEGMPAFGESLTDKEINALADYILDGIKNVDKYTSNNKPVSDVFKTEEIDIKLELVAEGMDIPWGMAFLPRNEMLVTDRNGKFYKVKSDKSLQPITGVPEVLSKGQGGLMDVVLDPDFAKNKLIYLSYSKFKNEGGSILATTAIMRAKLDGDKLNDQKDIFVAAPYSRTQHHYGSRMQFGKDGYLYFSVGERGNEKVNPQEIKGNDLGKVHRIKSDGSIPADNPFVKTTGAEASIYAYGHRNPQGMTIHPETGKIWTNEHGPRGGDEINIEEAGKNYGWPVITYGINYNGKPISNLTSKTGMVQPIHYWIPSIGPSGLAFVKGNKYKNWEGNLLSGSLRFKFLQRSILKGTKVVKEEILFKNIGRVRDVKMAPDGFIYIAVESPGRIYKLVPLN
ncbi:PQQ-dependent sugar dehydrogenase [Pedobacter nyackensis]|uniref:Glucose/arabinose dehydrogenase, beta-propeller fold n=1 Tax=Pedobacter nyackensis TaxID=475255 RepID=A0A1W2BAW1_9SPHI|nr:PQQ-dependent sugar dehydrogenase [Pedobacter nyackensis]SMC69508.1 Glucose/arabinose dehydrogenase, beta-propeller fold [Pedobacter nyackensis]